MYAALTKELGSTRYRGRYWAAGPARASEASINRDHRVSMITYLRSNNSKTKSSIVAIHGIGSHPDDTWSKNVSTDPDNPHYVNWLSNTSMLPSIAPNARVLRYGYESGWFRDDAIHQKASTVATCFLLALTREREVYY